MFLFIIFYLSPEFNMHLVFLSVPEPDEAELFHDCYQSVISAKPSKEV
jgi:hypothetical protein